MYGRAGLDLLRHRVLCCTRGRSGSSHLRESHFSAGLDIVRGAHPFLPQVPGGGPSVTDDLFWLCSTPIRLRCRASSARENREYEPVSSQS